jgi:ribosome-associated protein
MDIRKLQRAIVDGLEDVKAQDILVFNTEHLSPLFERVIIASGTSNRQTKALASGVREAVKAAGFPVLATEGGDNGEWIIVDCGAAVAHIMQPSIREYYRLEEIWGGKPVKMKIGGDGHRGLVKASEPDEEEVAVAMAPERRAAAKKAAVKKAPAKKVAAVAAKKVAKTPAQRTTSTRPAAKKAQAAEAEARKTAARKTAAAQAAKPKTAARKTPARKTAPGAAAPVRTIVVKPPARKTAAAKTGGARPAARAAGPARKTAARPAAKTGPKTGPKRG